MLIDVGDENITIDKLKTNLESQLKDYKEEYASQTKWDIGVRELILFQSKSGECQATMEELASSKNISLTNEQRDFIKMPGSKALLVAVGFRHQLLSLRSLRINSWLLIRIRF